MKKILLILENSPYANGGIERHCRAIIDMFANNRSISIDFLCKDNTLHSYNRLIGKVVFNPQALALMIKEYDVIHVHGFASYVAAQSLKEAILQNKQVVYTAHYHPFDKLRRPLLGKIFFNAFLRGRLSKIDQIIAINNEDKAFFEQFNPSVTVIPNWLSGIEKVDVPRAKNTILAVGRNDKNKALYHLNGIDFDRYDVHCVTNNDNGLDERINIHRDISDIDLALLYSSASLVVVPSYYEAFSYVALEALERGTPVLISDNVRIADHLDGFSGVDIFKFGDIDDFNRKIESTVGAMVDVAQIESKFGCEFIKSIFERIYNGK